MAVVVRAARAVWEARARSRQRVRLVSLAVSGVSAVPAARRVRQRPRVAVVVPGAWVARVARAARVLLQRRLQSLVAWVVMAVSVAPVAPVARAARVARVA